jgi:hypothetical protein
VPSPNLQLPYSRPQPRHHIAHAPEAEEGLIMNDSETVPKKLDDIANAVPVGRFMMRQGLRGLMVWDREAKGPAKIDGRQAVGLSEQQAGDIKIELTQFYAPRESEGR